MSEQNSEQTPRKAIPKGVRFEVFKRDSFKCQYCGASAPDIVLHVDHIKPVIDGGTNDITNLLTACSACNAGKGDKHLDDQTAVKKRKAQLDDLQERREQLEMMSQWTESLQDIKAQEIDRVVEYWHRLAPGFQPNERGRQSIKRWLARFSFEDVLKAMDIAASQYLDHQSDGKVTPESWELAYKKIQPILSVERDAKDDPDLKELLYIRGIIRNRCDRNYDNAEILDRLRAARSRGIPIANLRRLAHGVRDWNHFLEQVDVLITSWKEEDETQTQTPLPPALIPPLQKSEPTISPANKVVKNPDEIMRVHKHTVIALIDLHRQFKAAFPDEERKSSYTALEAFDSWFEQIQNPSRQKLCCLIDNMDAEVKAELLTLMWIGRGDGEAEDFEDMKTHALQNSRDGDPAGYLLGKQRFEEYLLEGMRKMESGVSVKIPSANSNGHDKRDDGLDSDRRDDGLDSDRWDDGLDEPSNEYDKGI